MSKREAYPIELLLKMKKLNPNRQFEGADLDAYNEFLEKEAENSLLDFLEKETPKKKKAKKVKQVCIPTATENIDYEIDEVPSEEEA